MQDSHRAECAGILGALVSLKRLLTKWNVSDGTVVFACDNMSALTYSFHHSRYPCITGQYPDFDLLQAIRSLSDTKITVAWEHVKGHQDDEIPYSLLSRPAQLNVQADKLATHRLLQKIHNITFSLQ